MALLTRPTKVDIFGSTALAAELTEFGSTTVSTDINVILNGVAAKRGWGTVGANDFPPLEWFNALGYGLSYYAAYIMQQGIPQWTALQEYYINSYATGSDGKVYKSLTGISGTPNTGNTPVGDAVNWKLVIGDGIDAVPTDGSTNAVSSNGVFDALALKAPIASPTFTGTPSAPTATLGTNTTQLATTAFVLANASTTPILAEFTVTGSAVTSIDFSGLDINAHGGSYEIEIRLNNATVSACNLYMYVNNDTVNTNYWLQTQNVNNATVGAARANIPAILSVGASQTVIGNTNLCLSLTTLLARAITIGMEAAGSIQNQYHIGWSKTATVSNITQLTFTSSVASSIGIGSKIIIRRRDK